MNKSIHIFRKWHVRIGLILALPLMAVATTAIIMAHTVDLGIKKMPVPWDLSWLPAYSVNNTGENLSLLKGVQSTLSMADGSEWIGTKSGLFLWSQGELKHVHGIHAHDIRSIRLAGENNIVIASQKGVWMQNDHDWRQIYPGEAVDAQILPNQVIRITSPDKGLLESTDMGVHWSPIAELNHVLVETPMKLKPKPLTVRQLVVDIHTGRVFFGSQWRWIWIDILAGSLLSLILLGLAGRVTRKPSPMLPKG